MNQPSWKQRVLFKEEKSVMQALRNNVLPVCSPPPHPGVLHLQLLPTPQSCHWPGLWSYSGQKSVLGASVFHLDIFHTTTLTFTVTPDFLPLSGGPTVDHYYPRGKSWFLSTSGGAQASCCDSTVLTVLGAKQTCSCCTCRHTEVYSARAFPSRFPFCPFIFFLFSKPSPVVSSFRKAPLIKEHSLFQALLSTMSTAAHLYVFLKLWLVQPAASLNQGLLLPLNNILSVLCLELSIKIVWVTELWKMERIVKIARVTELWKIEWVSHGGESRAALGEDHKEGTVGCGFDRRGTWL